MTEQIELYLDMLAIEDLRERTNNPAELLALSTALNVLGKRINALSETEFEASSLADYIINKYPAEGV